MVYRGKDDNLNTAGLVKARKKSPYSTNLQIRQVMVYRGKDDNLNTAGLVKARKKSPFSTNLQIRQVVVYKGKDDNLNTSGNIPVKRRRPQDLQKANSRNPAGRPALGSGLTPFRRKALMDLNGKRLYTHQAGTRSPGEFRKVMYKVRANPNTKLMMKGIASSGLELKEKTHPQSYHSPAWVRLIKGDMRNTVRVIHPSDLANKDIERYTGNIRRNPFRNRFLTADINGTGKMYFRVVTSRPHHAPGNPITIKQGKYVHAPLASRDALMVREPNKAMMKAVQMQANIKMKKTELQDLKTDAAFFKRQEAMEQGPGVKKRSFKNLFARLLGNSDLLSPRLKSKWLNPGYDPREKGLWAK